MTGISVLLFLATQTIQPIFPLYVRESGASTFDLGLIVSLMSLVAIISKVPLGILVERKGKWSIIPVALLGQFLSLILYSICPSISWFYPIRVFHALTLTAFAPTAIAIVSNLGPTKQRGDRIGRFLTSFGVATMLGPFFCSFLVEYLNYVEIFRIAATIPLLGLVIFFLGKRKFSDLHGSNSGRQDIGFSNLSFLRETVFSRNMVVLSFLRLVFSFTNAFFITLLAVYALENLLLTSSMIALLFGIKGVTNMLFRFPSGKLSDRIGHKILLILSFSLLTTAYLMISYSVDFLMLSFAMVIYGLAHGMRAVIEWSLMGDSIPTRIAGTAAAYLSTMFSIGEVLGAIISGALSLVIPVQLIFKIASMMVLPGAFIPLLIKRNRPANSSIR